MSIAIDQTASELRLHRVLYCVKYLRAMLLNLILVLVASALFVFAHIEGVYPLADDSIHNLKAQMENNPYGPWFTVWVGSFTFVFLLAFFFWVYLSITRVWRVALKLQAAFLVVCILLVPVWAWPQLNFSYENLSPLFSGLATLSFGLNIIIVLDIVIALWGAAASPERSSFVATLDPRLAPNVWTYLNKLLDLPRTPFQSWRTMVSYMLAFAGTVLLLASIMHLITIGNVSSKLGQLFAECGPTTMANCAAQSSIWAQQILLSLGIAFIGIRVAALMQTVAKRLGVLSVSDVIKRPGDRFVLYLRPFDTDDVILPKPRLPLLSKLLSFRPFPVRIEEELFDVAD